MNGCAPKSLRAKRKEHIERVLNFCRYDLFETARILDVTLSELERLMKELEIPPGNGCSDSGLIQRLELESKPPDTVEDCDERR